MNLYIYPVSPIYILDACQLLVQLAELTKLAVSGIVVLGNNDSGRENLEEFHSHKYAN